MQRGLVAVGQQNKQRICNPKEKARLENQPGKVKQQIFELS